MRKGIIPPTHPKTTLWPGEQKANMGTWENCMETTLSRARIRATLWAGAGRQIGGEREKNAASRIRGSERFIKSLKRNLLIPSLLTIGTADWTQAFGKALPLGCTQQGSTPCIAHTAVLPPTKPLQGPLWVYFTLETHHTSDVIPHWGLNSF